MQRMRMEITNDPLKKFRISCNIYPSPVLSGDVKKCIRVRTSNFSSLLFFFFFFNFFATPTGLARVNSPLHLRSLAIVRAPGTHIIPGALAFDEFRRLSTRLAGGIRSFDLLARTRDVKVTRAATSTVPMERTQTRRARSFVLECSPRRVGKFPPPSWRTTRPIRPLPRMHA